MCCCFVEDVGVHAQTLDTQPSRAPGSSVPSAPFLRHPRPATPGRQQRSPSCHSEAAQAPLCASPLGTHSHPPPARPHAALAGASRLPRSLQPWVTTLACRLLQEAPQRPPPRPPRSSRGRTALLSPDASAAGIPRCCARARRKPGASVRERPATSCPLPAHGRSLASTAAHRAAGTRRGWEAARRRSRPRGGTRAAKGQRTVPEAGGRRRAPGTAAGPPRPPPAPASSRRARGGRCSRGAGGVFCSLFSFFTDGAS